jgi:predicted membrane chloride channel (bestrophin family)
MKKLEFYSRLANAPRGLALETGRCSTAPDAIQQFATKMNALQIAEGAALSNLAAAVLIIVTELANINNSPGPISAADQTSLDSAIAAGNAVLAQMNAISTTPVGQPVPITPVPTP